MDVTLLVAVVVAAVCLIALATIAAGRWTANQWRRRRAPEADPELDLVGLAMSVVPLAARTAGAIAGLFSKGKGDEQVQLVGEDGTTTILFSDIAGSTQLNVRLGDELWVDILRTHDEVVDEQVRRYGGKVIKRQGDGFMAAFPEPEQAIGCARALSPALAARQSTPTLDLRIGIHTGEVITDRDDLFGTHVVLAARVAELARPGQILVSDPVAERLGDSGPAVRRVRWARLKGLPGRHVVHRVMA
ncbi:MAG: adenylate/guanylate cyclase domain-containing protein [Nitriliruptorales bacterium]|nr:adenylate/guanylate cyclase domain-containing protein [Nitriliruptorales bacterium]